MPSQIRTLPPPAPHGSRARITTDGQRGAGTLTAAEVRAAVARFLAPHEVAAVARAALARTSLRPHLDEIKAQFRGYAGGGLICNATARGLTVEINRPNDEHGAERGGLVPWRLLAQVVADGATPQRVAALADALASGDPHRAQQAAEAVVLAGPAATQLDILDALDALADVHPTEEQAPAGQRPRRQRKTSNEPGAARTRRPARTSGGAA